MRVFINEIEVDVLPLSIRPTYQSNDLNEIQNRNLSNAVLKFPKTPKNVEFFEHLDFQGSESEIPYRTTSCSIYVSGELHLKGVCKIRRTKENYYEGIAKEQAGDLFDLIKGKKLSDLDFSDLNHYLNINTFQAALGNTDTYIYAIGDFGGNLSRHHINTMQVARQSPSIFKHYIFDRILSDVGAFYQGDVFNTDGFLSETISLKKGVVDVGSVVETEVSQGFSENYQTPSDGTYAIDNAFNIELLDNEDRVSVSDNTKLVFKDKCKVKIVGGFSGGASATSAGQNYSLSHENYFRIDKNNAPTIYDYTGANSGELFDEIIEVEKGDEIRFEARTTATIVSGTGLSISNSLSTCKVQILEPYIDFNYLLGDISQSDFIKDIIKSYGMMFRIIPPYNFEGASEGDLVYDFTIMETLLNDRANAEDWSDKLSTKIESKKSIGSYGVNNYFKYKYQEDVTSNLDYTHESTNLNQAEDNTIIDSLYTVSDSTSYLTQETVRTPLYEKKDHYYKHVEVNTRTNKIVSNFKTFDIVDGRGNEATVSSLVSFITNVNVEWEFYYLNYFEAFSRIIDRPNKVKMSLYLKPQDIQNRDFFKLKYFKQEGRYFYLNKILKFREGYNTICELIEVQGYEAQTFDCQDYTDNNYIIPTYSEPTEETGGGGENTN